MTLEQLKSIMFGHAVGDALGVPVEFLSRDELEDYPVVDMREYGTHDLPKGAWSDDTSMSLATLESLTSGKVDLEDIMHNFVLWSKHDEFTSTGYVFDIGGTCARAINNFCELKLGVDECGLREDWSNGNGSLMRIHPIAAYLKTKDDLTLDEKMHLIYEVSALTHAHEKSLISCGIFSIVLWALLDSNGRDKNDVIKDSLKKARSYYENSEFIGDFEFFFTRLIDLDENPAFRMASIDEIDSGGYVLSSLVSAFYCLITTSTYKDCVLKAVNLGRDTDTTACIAGALAGAYYGIDNIPQEWLNVLLRKDYIDDMCKRAFAVWTNGK